MLSRPGSIASRIPVVVDTGNSGPVPAEDHISCGTLKGVLFSGGPSVAKRDQMVQGRRGGLCVCGGQASREIPTRQGASGAERFEPGRHRPRTEDHNSTTHIDIKLHAFLCRVGLV